MRLTRYLNLIALVIVCLKFLPGHSQIDGLEPCRKFPGEFSSIFWSNNAHCYYYSTVPQTAMSMDARRKCRDANKHLVTIESVEELNFLTRPNNKGQTFLPSDRDIWTGLVKMTESSYQWVWEENDGLQSDEQNIGQLLAGTGPPGPGTPERVHAVLKNGELLVPDGRRRPDGRHSFVCEDDNPSEAVAATTCKKFDQPDLNSTVYNSLTMKCYYVFNNFVTWDEARDVCEADFGSHLVFMEKPHGPRSWLAGELSSRSLTSNYWIGLTLNPTTSQWNWVTQFSSQPMRSSHFSATPRPSSKYAFLEPTTDKWGDSESDTFKYICEETTLNTYLHHIMCEDLGPNKASFYLHSSQSCYFIDIRVFSFTDAKSMCEKMNSHLVSLSNVGEQAFIQNIVKHTGSRDTAWIGLVFDKEWKWDKGGYSTLLGTFSGWEEPIPMAPAYNHVILTANGWTQASQAETHHVVCQQPISDSLNVSKIVCPQDLKASFVYFSYRFHSCYNYFTTPSDFNTAQTYCHKKGGHLFVPETVEEQEEVISILQQDGLDSNVWLGLERLNVGLWVWLYNNKKMLTDTTRFPSLTNSLPQYVRSDGPTDILQTQSGTEVPVLCEQKVDVPMLRNTLKLIRAERNKSRIEESLDTTTTPPEPAFTACSKPSIPGQIQNVHFKRIDQLNETMSNMTVSRRPSSLACSKECSKSPFCFLYVLTFDGHCWTFQRSLVSELLNDNVSNCSVNQCFQRICQKVEPA